MSLGNKQFKTKAFIICFCITFLVGFCLGGINGDAGYAASGSLDSEYGKWQGDSSMVSGESITVELAGNYTITVNGGGSAQADGTVGKGGAITGIIYLNKGDVLSAYKYSGGAAVSSGSDVPCSSQKGGDACMIFLNGSPLIGAGGAGGAGARRNYISSTYSWTDTIYSYSSGVTTLNNARFSAGGSGGAATARYQMFQVGKSGATMDGCTSAAGGGANVTSNVQNPVTSASAGESGANYLDSNRINFVSMTNDSSFMGFVVSYEQITEEDLPSIWNNYVSQWKLFNTTASRYVDAVTSGEGLSVGGGSNSSSSSTSSFTADMNQYNTPIITVVAGEPFDVLVGFYDDMQSGSVDGITVTKTTVGDGVVEVSGTLTTPGKYTMKVNQKTFGFNVVEEPNSSNVLVLLQ